MKLSSEAIDFLNVMVDYVEENDWDVFESGYDFKYDLDNTIQYIREIEETDIIDGDRVGDFVVNAVDHILELTNNNMNILIKDKKHYKIGWEQIQEKL